MIVRITTERKNVKWMSRLISQFYSGFTIYNTTGYWYGVREKSIVFEIDTMDDKLITLDLNIKMIVKKICGYNQQQCVLVQKIESDSCVLDSHC